MASWSFLTNHGLVLTFIGRYPDSTGLEIAQAVGITERAARKIVADLLAEGYVEWERVGRRNSYRLNTHLPLRHPAERTATVGELLGLLWREKTQMVSPIKAPTETQAKTHGASDEQHSRPRLQPQSARRARRA